MNWNYPPPPLQKKKCENALKGRWQIRIRYHAGGTHLFWGYGGLKNWFSGERSKELKIFNIMGAYELKFGPNLGCRTESSFNFWLISLGVKMYYFLLKVWVKRTESCCNWGTKLGNGERGVKRGSWPSDIFPIFKWVPRAMSMWESRPTPGIMVLIILE